MIALLTTSITVIVGVVVLWITIGIAVLAVRVRRPTLWLFVLWGICQTSYDVWYLSTGMHVLWLAMLRTLAIIAFFMLRTPNDTFTVRQLFLFWQ